MAAAGPGGPLAQLASELGGLGIDYDDWQVVYRQLTQLGRALEGAPQLLEHGSVKEEAMASNVEDGGSIRPPLDASSTTELLSQLVDRSTALIKKEIELAKVELGADARREVKMVEGLSAAAVCALFGLNLVLVAVVFALALVLPGWAAALIIASPFIVAAVIVGIVSWNKRVRSPLGKTRKTLEEDARWARQRIA